MCVGAWVICAGRLGGDDAESAWAAASAVRMSSQLCSRARSSKTAPSSGVPHRWAYCSESLRRVPTSAPSGGEGGQGLRTWASEAPHGTTTDRRRPCGPRAGNTWRALRPCRRSSFVGRCRPARHAPRRTTRGSVGTAHNRSASIRGGRDVRPDSRWLAPRPIPHAPARQEVASPTAGTAPAGRARRRQEPARSAAGARRGPARGGSGRGASLGRAAPPRRTGSEAAGVDDEAHVPVSALHHHSPRTAPAPSPPAPARWDGRVHLGILEVDALGGPARPQAP